MELYDKEYFAALKERIKTLDKRPILVSLIYTVISIIFFFVWSNLILEIPLLILFPIGLLIPFILLFSVAKREHSKSLLAVIGIMSSTIYFELFDLAYYYTIYLDNPLKMDSDVCPICEIQDSICLIIISLIAIVLMTTVKLMTTKFNLSNRSILLAILLPSTILLLRMILFLTRNFI